MPVRLKVNLPTFKKFIGQKLGFVCNLITFVANSLALNLMAYPSTDKFPTHPPTGMSSITGQKLDVLKGIYHDLISSVIDSVNGQTLLFSHFGDFDQAKSDSALKMVESMIIEAGDKRQTMKRVCNLLIEILQNISLHGARDRSGHMHAFLIVARSQKGYRVLTGNLVLASDMKALVNRMDDLLKLDENELRRLYIEILCNEEFSHKGGAGLGLITVAKRAEQNLRYRTHDLDNNFGYFEMEVELSKS
jgi:hypothetical protein